MLRERSYSVKQQCATNLDKAVDSRTYRMSQSQGRTFLDHVTTVSNFMDSAQSSSNECKNYLLKVYS